MKMFMNHTTMRIVLLMIAATVFFRGPFLHAGESGHEAFVVISGGDSVDLRPAKDSEGNLKTPKWAAPDNKRVLFGTFPTADAWQEGSVSFVPESDGIVSLLLRGPLVRPPGEPNALEQIFVDYDVVSIEGGNIPNGSFEELASLDVPEGWKYYVPSDNVTPITEANRARVLEGDAAEGSKFVRVWHNSAFANTFQVKAGQKVTIHFSYREAPTP